jgi:hypothetical protein
MTIRESLGAMMRWIETNPPEHSRCPVHPVQEEPPSSAKSSWTSVGPGWSCALLLSLLRSPVPLPHQTLVSSPAATP